MDKVVSLCFVPLAPTPDLSFLTSNQTICESSCPANATDLLISTAAPTSKHGHHTYIQMLLMLALVVGCLAWSLLKMLAKQHTKYWHQKGVPSPRSEPFVGHLDQLPPISQPFDMSSTLVHFEHWSKEYGKIYGLQLGWRNLLMVGDGPLLHQVFVDKAHCFHKIQILPTRDNPQNIFFSNGEVWKKLHNIAVPAFTVRNMKKMIPIFCDSSLQLAHLLKQQIGCDTINIQPYMQVLAWQVLSRTALGSRAKSMSEDQLAACSQLAKQLIEEDRRRELPLNGNKWMNLLDRYSLMLPLLSPLFSSIGRWLWMDCGE